MLAETLNQATDAARVAAWAAIICTLITTVGVIFAAVIARGNRNATRRAAAKAEETAENLDTGNGQTLGAYIVEMRNTQQQLGRLMEVTNGRVHDVSKRTDNASRDINTVAVQVAEMKSWLMDVTAYMSELRARDEAARAGEIDRRQEEP